MNLRLFIHIILISLFLVLVNVDLSADEDNDIPTYTLLNVRGGYSQLAGHYADQMNGGPLFGVSIVPYSYWYIMGELDFTYSYHTLKESSGSKLYVYSFSIGPLLYYPLYDHMHLYGGISFMFSYMNLNAVLTDRNESAYKPGVVIKAGLFFPLRYGIRLRLGTEYALNELSGKMMHRINYYAGISYNFNYLFSTSDPGTERDVEFARVERLYRLGVNDLSSGKIENAKARFDEVLSLDSKHKQARQYSEMIDKKQKVLQSAINLLNNQKYFKAIPMLEDAGSLLPAAKTELTNVRNKLSGKLPVLQRRGINAYERKDYQSCIGIMLKIKLIEPKNRVVKIYLPRARKRYEALKRLK